MQASAINLNTGAPPELAWIEIGKIFVDESYQRPIKPRRVQQILKDFTWAQFGALMLVAREDGRFAVYDGQHRFEAARQHPAIDAVPAAIVVLDQAFEEAQNFLGVNINRSAISTVEKYWAGIEAGDKQMMQICAVLEEAGCEVVPIGSKSAAPGRTSAITAIERAIRSYGDAAVTQACQTLREAWPKDVSGLNGSMIQALARLFRNNRRAIDQQRMVTKLHGKDRKILVADAETFRKMGGGDAALNIAKVLVEVYNKGLQKDQISLGVKE